jgi:hypothetical protein
MALDVPYALVPAQDPAARDTGFRWNLAGEVTMVRRAEAPASPGVNTMLIDGALWSDELPPGTEGLFGKDDHFLLARIGENRSFEEMKAFLVRADPGFDLLRAGERILSLSTGPGGVTMNGGVYLMLRLTPEEWSRLPTGATYTLRPLNHRAGSRWRVDPALRIVRP